MTARLKGLSSSWGPGVTTGSEAKAGYKVTVCNFMTSRRSRYRGPWRRTDPPQLDVVNWVQNIGWLTLGELREVNEALIAIVNRHNDRQTRPGVPRRPTGSASSPGPCPPPRTPE